MSATRDAATVRATYTHPTATPVPPRPNFVLKHAQDGMVDVRSKGCGHSGCNTYPSFGYPGTGKVERCAQHAEDGMVDVAIDRRRNAGEKRRVVVRLRARREGLLFRAVGEEGAAIEPAVVDPSFVASAIAAVVGGGDGQGWTEEAHGLVGCSSFLPTCRYGSRLHTARLLVPLDRTSLSHFLSSVPTFC